MGACHTGYTHATALSQGLKANLVVACHLTGIVTCRTASRQRQPASFPEKAPDPHSHLIGYNVLALQPRGKGNSWIGAVIEVHFKTIRHPV